MSAHLALRPREGWTDPAPDRSRYRVHAGATRWSLEVKGPQSPQSRSVVSITGFGDHGKVHLYLGPYGDAGDVIVADDGVDGGRRQALGMKLFVNPGQTTTFPTSLRDGALQMAGGDADLADVGLHRAADLLDQTRPLCDRHDGLTGLQRVLLHTTPLLSQLLAVGALTADQLPRDTVAVTDPAWKKLADFGNPRALADAVVGDTTRAGRRAALSLVVSDQRLDLRDLQLAHLARPLDPGRTGRVAQHLAATRRQRPTSDLTRTSTTGLRQLLAGHDRAVAERFIVELANRDDQHVAASAILARGDDANPATVLDDLTDAELATGGAIGHDRRIWTIDGPGRSLRLTVLRYSDATGLAIAGQQLRNCLGEMPIDPLSRIIIVRHADTGRALDAIEVRERTVIQWQSTGNGPPTCTSQVVPWLQRYNVHIPAGAIEG